MLCKGGAAKKKEQQVIKTASTAVSGKLYVGCLAAQRRFSFANLQFLCCLGARRESGSFQARSPTRKYGKFRPYVFFTIRTIFSIKD